VCLFTSFVYILRKAACAKSVPLLVQVRYSTRDWIFGSRKLERNLQEENLSKRVKHVRETGRSTLERERERGRMPRSPVERYKLAKQRGRRRARNAHGDVIGNARIQRRKPRAVERERHLHEQRAPFLHGRKRPTEGGRFVARDRKRETLALANLGEENGISSHIA